jgi:predicted N-acyltransferase
MNTKALWTVRWFASIDHVDRRQWDKLAVPLSTPLLEWQWLHHLEASGSISPRLGWQPHHLTLWDGQELVGAAPLYLKTNSNGEFIFDHWWGQLAAEYGVNYYPKLVGMSPATPSVGYRFLMAEGVDRPGLMVSMLAAIDRFCLREQLSGCHFHYVDLPWFARFPSDGFTSWQHQSYLWKNCNFTSFEEYLQTFNSAQRRNIRRERQSMARQGVEIRTFTGDAIPSAMAATMYRCYLDTNDRYGPWAARFLNGDFFTGIFQDFRHHLLIVAAFKGGSAIPIAMAMLLVKDRHLIGRYWGCAEPVKDLHFNMCFYAPIEWAIDNGIATFDPGIGSPHKIYRGFAAVANTSLHRLYDRRLKSIFEQLIDRVNSMTAGEIDAMNDHLPFADKHRHSLPVDGE